MAGVSRTTLSNVINGNAKRVSQAYGMYSLQDSFVGELVGTIQMEAEMKGYYVMLIGGENIQNVVDIASRWNVEGLIILGYNDEKYRKLSRKLNKKMVLIDAYPAGEYFFQNVGVDDYSGGYQIGSASYLLVLLPVLIVYIFCQKWIMNGVVAGAVK